jgi:hypothetical protein
MNTELLGWTAERLSRLLSIDDPAATREIAQYLLSIPALEDKRAYLEDLLGRGDPRFLDFAVELQDRFERVCV